MANRHGAGKRPGLRQAPPQVLLRGLSVIEALNRRAVSSVEDIARDTRLPKPTVVRVLGQLADKGYAQQLPHRRGYVLGERVLALSAGYRSPDAVIEIAQPLLSRFTAEHKWPVSLATLDGSTMRIRAGTLQQSPFSTFLDQGRLARRVPMLTSAVGLAYLAFAPADERETLLRVLRRSQKQTDALARDEGRLGPLLSLVLQHGYATTPARKGEEALGLAVPVVADGRVLACITIRYLGKAITEQQIAQKYLMPLKAMAQAISASFASDRSRPNAR